jgi:hypothetical protein
MGSFAIGIGKTSGSRRDEVSQMSQIREGKSFGADDPATWMMTG